MSFLSGFLLGRSVDRMANIEDLNRFERARIIGARSFQISMGAPPLIKMSEESERWNPITIARLEFEKGVIPITVVRD